MVGVLRRGRITATGWRCIVLQGESVDILVKVPMVSQDLGKEESRSEVVCFKSIFDHREIRVGDSSGRALIPILLPELKN